jgi:hypothetical protein
MLFGASSPTDDARWTGARPVVDHPHVGERLRAESAVAVRLSEHHVTVDALLSYLFGAVGDPNTHILGVRVGTGHLAFGLTNPQAVHFR